MAAEILKLLSGLIEHARSSHEIGNNEQASAFAGRAQEILTRHKLTMEGVQARSKETHDPIHIEGVNPWFAGFPVTRQPIGWQLDLAKAIAAANQCAVLMTHCSNTVIFAGRKTDRLAARELFLYFLELARYFGNRELRACRNHQKRLCTERWGDEAGHHMDTWMSDFRDSYHRGFTHSIALCLLASHNAILADEQAEYGVSAPGLVRLDKDALAVDRFMEQHYRHRPPPADDAESVRAGGENLNPYGCIFSRTTGDQVALTSKAIAEGD